jgi:hypothetical protein
MTQAIFPLETNIVSKSSSLQFAHNAEGLPVVLKILDACYCGIQNTTYTQFKFTSVHEIGHRLIVKGKQLYLSHMAWVGRHSISEYNDYFDGYYDTFYNFKLANQISARSYIENQLLQIFEHLGIQNTISFAIKNTNTPAINGLFPFFFGDDCCLERSNEAIQVLYKALFLKESDGPSLSELVEQVVEFVLEVKDFIALLKRIAAEIIRFQFLSLLIHNRLSRNPTPQKKEPPVGGVKIGGEQYGRRSHVARKLYQQKNFILATC